MADLAGISEGVKKATGYDELEALKGLLRRFFPKSGDPGEAMEGKATRDPEERTGELDDIYKEWMDTGEGLEGLREEDLMSLFDEIRGYEDQSPETMIEELTRYRDRYYQ